MPTWRNVAQVLPEPHAAVERMVACVLGHQHCQALAAAGGGQRPGFTVLATQPESATATDGSRYSSANIYGFTPALTAPVILASSLARGLDMAVPNAAALLDQFTAAGIAVEFTHRSKRRLWPPFPRENDWPISSSPLPFPQRRSGQSNGAHLIQ